jgi:NADPH-dependent glutamate synthase beta subunit-like oxidoreductase
MRPYHVAIVGAGPSGFFAAASLLKFADSTEDADVRVDMLEMLPTPWGLVRSGVAPDHPKIKSVSAQFEKTALDPRFRFFGNIIVGDHVQPAELADRYDAAGKVVRNNIKILRGYAARGPRGAKRRIVFRFRTSPIEIGGDREVESIVLGRNELVDDHGRIVARDTGEREEVSAQLVVRAVGYRSVAVPGLPFDDDIGTIPHHEGRIDGRRNEYVVGWIKRGPTGVIGSNKKDSQDTVDTLIADLRGTELADVGAEHSEELNPWLLQRPPTLITDVHWKLIDERAFSGPDERPAAGEADHRGRNAAHPPRSITLPPDDARAVLIRITPSA